MTRQALARRMRWLIASLLAILGLAGTLRWAEARLEAFISRSQVGRKPTAWVTLDGVEYRPTEEVSPSDQGSRRTHRASVEACDPVSGRRLWKVTIREGTWPEGMGTRLDRPRSNHAHFLAGFALKLAAREGKIAVATRDGAEYLIHPETRSVVPIRAAAPPPGPPILDARRLAGTRCEAHDRPLLEGVVPIDYGLLIVDPKTYEARKTRFPHAFSSYGGGCVIGESSQARVLYCPDCRAAEREWIRKGRPGADGPRRMTDQVRLGREDRPFVAGAIATARATG